MMIRRFTAWGMAMGLVLGALPALADLNGELDQVIRSWDVAKFQLPKEKKEEAFATLATQAKQLVTSYPERAEPRVWAGIVLSTYAGEKGGLGALSLVKEARDLLLEAEKIAPEILDGSVYTSLGSLYYQVPGWPIGFGDDKLAAEYLNKAVALDDDGIDSNYFMGDFLLDQGEYSQAVGYFEKAMNAPGRPGREIADAGRKEEARLKLEEVNQRLSKTDDPAKQLVK